MSRLHAAFATGSRYGKHAIGLAALGEHEQWAKMGERHLADHTILC